MGVLFAIVIVRLLVPFLVLRWPFWGALAIMAADIFDFTLLDKVGFGVLGSFSYQSFDKLLDLYGLFFQFYAAGRLVELKARRILQTLFSWRLAGIVLFELTGIRKFLFFAPNIFEYFYLLVFGAKKFAPGVSLEKNKNLIILFIIAALPKLILEYILHFKEYPLGLRRLWELIWKR